MKTPTIPLGLTYDDVLLVPKKSTISSRMSVNLSTNLSRNITLSIPFVSSNVDTVTESGMAIAMAKMGGLGIIHRFMTIERQLSEVRRVKRSEGFVMGTPFTLRPGQTVGEARRLMKEHHVTSAVIVNDKGTVLGLVSERDMWFLSGDTKTMEELMTRRDKLITAPVHIPLAGARELFRKHKVEKLPLLNRDGTLGGLITSRTVLNEDIFPHATKDRHGRLRVGAAVGVVGDYLDRCRELVKAGVDAIVVDIAHIHSTHGLLAVKALRRICQNTDLVGGNIATADAARDLVRLGCDAIKVGIGPGGICITRMVAGAGVPQLTALLSIAPVVHRARIPMIADGGTNYPADMTKALAAGASTVMLTGWLAGTDESPGSVILRKGQKYKVHRGAASFSAVASRTIDYNELEEIVPEGVETFVPYKGAAKDVIHQLSGALRSGMSYSNAKTIADLWKNVEFIRISPAGFRESREHNIQDV